MESETRTQTSTPSSSPAPAEVTRTLHQAHRFGTVVPNRIFVGGIDMNTSESDLGHFFSQYGMIKEVKIVVDRAGVSKGYGFVTFETQEDAQKILDEADRLCFRDKRLNIAQAIRKPQMGPHGRCTVASPPLALPAPFNTTYLTTPTGYPYTYHNGMAYFPAPEPSTHTSQWTTPQCPMPGPSIMVTHSPPSFCTSQPYHPCQAASQFVPGHAPWAVPQLESPVPVNPSPLLFVQPAELMYQPMEMPADKGCVQSAMLLMEAAVPEAHGDHMGQPPHQICMQNPIVAHDGVKEEFHLVRRGFSHSAVHTKPRHYRVPHYAHLRRNYRPDLAHASSPSASSSTEEVLQ